MPLLQPVIFENGRASLTLSRFASDAIELLHAWPGDMDRTAKIHLLMRSTLRLAKGRMTGQGV